LCGEKKTGYFLSLLEFAEFYTLSKESRLPIAARERSSTTSTEFMLIRACQVE
jgi:hypothetical protein